MPDRIEHPILTEGEENKINDASNAMYDILYNGLEMSEKRVDEMVRAGTEAMRQFLREGK